MKQINIGELEIPLAYFEYSKEEKEVFCLELLEVMLISIERNLKGDFDKLDILDQILQSSIITNLETENYEICAVFSDMRKLLNERN